MPNRDDIFPLRVKLEYTGKHVRPSVLIEGAWSPIRFINHHPGLGMELGVGSLGHLVSLPQSVWWTLYFEDDTQ